MQVILYLKTALFRIIADKQFPEKRQRRGKNGFGRKTNRYGRITYCFVICTGVLQA